MAASMRGMHQTPAYMPDRVIACMCTEISSYGGCTCAAARGGRRYLRSSSSESFTCRLCIFSSIWARSSASLSSCSCMCATKCFSGRMLGGVLMNEAVRGGQWAYCWCLGSPKFGEKPAKTSPTPHEAPFLRHPYTFFKQCRQRAF